MSTTLAGSANRASTGEAIAIAAPITPFAGALVTTTPSSHAAAITITASARRASHAASAALPTTGRPIGRGR